MNKLKEWLMVRYCPNYEEQMPKEDNDQRYVAVAVVIWGYWGQNSTVISSQKAIGIVQAYKEARWLALKAQWKNPSWLCNCGINYGIVKEAV